MRGAAAALPRRGPGLRSVAAGVRRVFRPPSTTVRRRLVYVLALALVLGAAYVLWFRDSSFVRVERVTVTGLVGTDAPRERAGLIAAARDMTTLHYDEAALRRALGAGAKVESIRVTAELPHALRVAVVEKTPVALVEVGPERVAVGSGAVLLPDVKAIPRGLPEIAVAALPAGQRLQDGRSRRLVAAATALPPALRTRVERLREVPGAGVVGYLRDGPRVLLGAPTRLEVKWITAAAILADPASRGAAYVDVRVPERPVAGGLAPRPQAASATTTPGSSSPLGPSSP